MDYTQAVEKITVELDAVLHAVDSAHATAFTSDILASGRIFTTGEGRSGLVARAFAMRLAHLGFRAHVVGETTTPPMEDADLLVAVSGSGETAITVHIASIAKEVGARVAAVTADSGSTLALASHSSLVVPGAVKTGKGFPSVQMPGSLFEQAALLTLEAIVLMLADRKGATHDDMRRRHANIE